MKKILFIFSIIFFISTNGSAITTIYGGPTTVKSHNFKLAFN